MKKMFKKAVILALAVTMLLSMAVPAFAAAPKLKTEDDVVSIKFPKDWYVYGRDEEIDQAIIEWLGQTEKGMEQFFNETGAYVFAANDTNPSYFYGYVSNDVIGDISFSEYTAEDMELLAKAIQMGDIVDEAYQGNGVNYILSTYTSQAESGSYGVITAYTCENKKAYNFEIIAFEVKDMDVLKEQLKQILDTVEYNFNETEPVPADYEFKDAGLKFTLDDKWSIRGQKIEKDDPVLDSLGISKEEYEKTMKENNRYVYGYKSGSDISYSLYVYALDASGKVPFEEYTKKDIEDIAADYLTNLEKTYTSIEKVEKFDALYSGCYEADNAKYMMTSVYVKYDDGFECVENAAITLVGGTYYEYYYYEYEDKPYKTKFKEDLKNFEAFLDTVEYSKPTAKLTSVNDASKVSGPTLEEDIMTIKAMIPHLRGLEDKLIEYSPALWALVIPVLILGALVGGIVAIIHFAVKSKRRKAKARAKAAENIE
ncbi:MAG: hypothetical protein IJL87_05240 [Clostridia bacterium]|nr:hypothetical protein [Clostridia bacterium]